MAIASIVSDTADADLEQAEYAEHVGTYRGFLHLLRWFAAHVLVMLTGLYVMVMQANSAFGLFIMLIGLGILGYGVTSTGRVDHEARDAALPRHS